jgi:uncharacterized protein YijF (DUF1287 family)
MERRAFLAGALASTAAAFTRPEDGEKLARAAKAQLGVTTGYDPRYVRLPYPGGDVPRTTGVCADVVVRAGRDALGLDLQKLVHEDMLRDFAAYPKTWGMHAPDSNIDHRRVLNLEVFWNRAGAAVWTGNVAGDGFEGAMKPGDLLTWLLDGRLPHVGVVVGSGMLGTQVVHNIGSGVQQNSLYTFRGHRAKGHYRWA